MSCSHWTIALLLAACAAAQQPAPSAAPVKSSLSAEEIIEKSIAASGGRAAMEKLSSTFAKGVMEFSAQEMHGTMEIYAKAPNKQLVVMMLESVGEIRQGFDGTVAWAREASGHILELTGGPLEDMRRNAVFNAALKWREIFPKVELAGEETIDGRTALAVRFVPASGKAITRYFDAASFLMLRETGTRETPQGPIDVRADFSDYRDVNGIKAPFQIRQSMPFGQIVVNITELKNNVEIEDARFTKPAEAKPDAAKPTEPKPAAAKP